MPFPHRKPARATRTRPARAPDQVVFQAFFERDAMRERRRRSRRNTLILSIMVHAVALLALVVYSFWRVEELWSPSVPVKVYSPEAYRQALRKAGLSPAAAEAAARASAMPSPR
jgi:hypothetical protein